MNYHAAWNRLTDELIACHGRAMAESDEDFHDIAMMIEATMDLMESIEDEIPVRLEKLT